MAIQIHRRLSTKKARRVWRRAKPNNRRKVLKLSITRIRRALALIGLGGLIAAGVSIPNADASPGQCGYGGGFGSGGGFCDYPPRPDGTWYHCETVYVLGWGGTNCFYVRPVPLDVDPRGWVPA